MWNCFENMQKYLLQVTLFFSQPIGLCLVSLGPGTLAHPPPPASTVHFAHHYKFIYHQV